MLPFAELNMGYARGYIDKDNPLHAYISRKMYLESNTGIYNTSIEQKQKENEMAVSAVHLDSLGQATSTDRFQTSVSPTVSTGNVSSGSSSAGLNAKQLIIYGAIALLFIAILKKDGK